MYQVVVNCYHFFNDLSNIYLGTNRWMYMIFRDSLLITAYIYY